MARWRQFMQDRLGRLEAVLARRPWLGELPWILCVLWASVALWQAEPRLPWAAGSDWHQYVSAAWYFWRHDVHGYPDWRNPLYPFLVSVLGQDDSYVHAGQTVARLSGLAVLFSAGLLARALAGRAAAIAAVFTTAGLSYLGVVLHWVNHYPLLGALTGLTLAFGALALRSGSALAMAATGLSGGLCLAVDTRGLAPAAVGMGLVLLAVPGRPLKRALPGLVLALGLALAPQAWDQQVRTAWGIRIIPLQTQVTAQRALVLDQFRLGQLRDPAVLAACVPPLAPRMDLEALRAPCSQAMRAFNLRTLLQDGLWPPKATGWIGLLALLPALGPGWDRSARPRPVRAALRSVLGSLAVFGGAALSLDLGMRWVSYTDRYLFQYVVPAMALVPVAAGRLASLAELAGWLPRRLRQLVPLLLGGLAMAYGAQSWPGQASARAARMSRESDAVRGRVMAWVNAEIPAQDTVIDCALVDAGLLRAPTRVDYRAYRPELPECFDLWGQPPEPGLVWLLVQAPGTAHTAPTVDELHQGGWTPAPIPFREYGLWRHGD